MKRLLLISNSTLHGGGYLQHCEQDLRDFLGDARRILFIPYALFDRDGYAATARKRYRELGIELTSIHETGEPKRAVQEAEAIFTGGGNTFRLLETLYTLDLVDTLRQQVEQGTPYVGTSAGSNVACVSIRTTNDMPIVQPPSFDALNLVPFNINPHYLDPDPSSTHMGETRETRIREFLEENDNIVVGLREGAMLRVEGDRVELRGSTAARVFRRDQEPAEHQPVADMSFLLG